MPDMFPALLFITGIFRLLLWVLTAFLMAWGNLKLFCIAFEAFQTWSLTLREECRQRVFENRVLTRIFGPKTDEVRGDWRGLHNE
jgi:hypothetical protein